MRRAFWMAVVVLSLALAVIVGLRLERAGLAVVVGVVCGIAAGLPVSGVLFYLFWRERQERLQEEERHWRERQRGAMQAPAAPPVVILNAGRRAEQLPPSRLLGEPAERAFTIVGEEEWGRESSQ